MFNSVLQLDPIESIAEKKMKNELIAVKDEVENFKESIRTVKKQLDYQWFKVRHPPSPDTRWKERIRSLGKTIFELEKNFNHFSNFCRKKKENRKSRTKTFNWVEIK